MTDRIPHQAKNLRRHRALLDGADAGLYTLPAELIDQRTAIMRLGDELATTSGPDPAAAEGDHLAALIAAAKTGRKTLPDCAPVLDAEAAAGRAQRRVLLLSRAIELADAELGGIVTDTGDDIIRQHLAPAVADVMTAVTAASGALPAEVTADAVLRADDAARRAWLELADHAARYDAVRRAATSVRRIEQPEWDTRGDFSELHNFNEVTAGYTVQIGGPRPWPTDTGQRLLWYVRNGGRVWLPTIAEQDARYREVHRERIEQVQQSRAAALSVRHSFG